MRARRGPVNDPTMEELHRKAMIAKGELEKHGLRFDVHLTERGEDDGGTTPALLQVTLNTPLVIELAAMLAAFLSMQRGVVEGNGDLPPFKLN